MKPHIRSIPFLAIAMLVIVAARGAEPAPEMQPGTLRLLTDTKPADQATLDALAATRWAWYGAKNILGRGTDQFATFRVDKDKGLLIELTDRTWRSVNDRPANAPRYVDKQSTFPRTVRGPILWYDDHQQTFALVPGKAIVLNAVVPLGNGRWYYAARRTLGKQDVPPFRDEEMLFDFGADDPLRAETGKGVLHLRSGDNPPVKEDVQFKVTHTGRDGRIINVRGVNDRSLAEIQFPPEGKYGRLLDHPNLNSQVFTPARAGD
jgi:hypothetical protein